MKKKIAVFANGLNSENLMNFMIGLKDNTPEGLVDYYVFLSHDSYGSDEVRNRAEWCIFDLPNMGDFDGAILFGPGLNFESVNNAIIDRCNKAGIPVICISSEYENTTRIYTDNYEGMKLLIDHMLDEHGIKNILFIAGPKDNPESDARLQAVRDALAVRNIPLLEDNIFYSNWVAYTIIDFLTEKVGDRDNLPDAIICANDNTAFFVTLILEDNDLSCPDDILVTGFDGNYQTMTYYPAITTVVQPFTEMGQKCAECIVDSINGKTIATDYYIPCSLRIAESCGCDTNMEFDLLRRQFSKKQHRDDINGGRNLLRANIISDAVSRSESYDTIDRCLQEVFYTSEGFEGNPIFICMDPLFARLGNASADDLPKYKFSDEFVMLVGKVYDKKYGKTTFNKNYGLIPYYDEDENEDNKTHIHVFTPLIYKTFVCGYIVMIDDIARFGNRQYELFQSTLNSLLDPYRKNMQLTDLNVTLSKLMNKDVLTSTKNRTAFVSYRDQLQNHLDSSYIKNLAFVVADINNLKTINDTFGHDKGDMYIKKASSIICKVFKHSPVFRMGGDEFLVVLQDADYENRDALIASLQEVLDQVKKTETDPVERVSFAYGLAAYDSSIDQSIDDTIKRADELMYENKRKTKLQND